MIVDHRKRITQPEKLINNENAPNYTVFIFTHSSKLIVLTIKTEY